MEHLKKIMTGEGGNFVAPFLWLHNEDDTLIVRELERMRECGIGAVCIESRTHEQFCREDWWSDVRLILDTCKKLGMKLWILDDKHFPSGYANGIFEEKYKHLQPRNIRARRVDMAGPMRAGQVLANEWKALPTDEILGAVALRRGEDGLFDGTHIDISSGYRNGCFYFDLPEGIWAVVILIATQADIAPRYRAYCDKLSAEATDAYLEEVYESHYKHFANEFGDTLLGFFADEPAFHCNQCKQTGMGDQTAGYPWHKNVYNALTERWGKNTFAMLCRIWFPFSDGTAEAARQTYMDIITALYRDNFSARIGKWCEDHGVMYVGHIIEDNGMHRKLGSGCGHYFRALEGQHMSGVDVVLHQIVPGLTEVANTGYVSYWEMDNRLNHYILGKLASSAAHAEEKKQGRALCEIFGAYGWAEDLTTMKYLADHFLVRGVNYYVPHAFSPKENDTDCPPNFYNSGNNPQYKYFDKLIGHLNRASALISGGVHIPTCAVLYDAEAYWGDGEYCDNREICKILYDAQLDYDILPWDRLQDMDDEGHVGKEAYPVLLVPYCSYFSEEQKTLLSRLAKRVVIVGEKSLPGFTHIHPNALVTFMTPYRDVTVENGGKYVRYYHYEREGAVCYLFANEDITRTLETTVRLRGFEGGSYTLYDPFENVAVTRHSKDGTIPLTLAPYNMVAVLIGDASLSTGRMIFEENKPAKEILSPTWEISVCEEKNLPAYRPYKTTDALESITGPDALSGFSGNTRYTAKVDLKKTPDLVLDLGEVGSTAEVKVNGVSVGTRVYPPYRFAIGDAVVDGENTLEITVTNTCVFAQRDGFSRYLPIRASGLMGPVTLR